MPLKRKAPSKRTTITLPANTLALVEAEQRRIARETGITPSLSRVVVIAAERGMATFWGSAT